MLRLYSIFSHHNDGLFVILKFILYLLLHCFKLYCLFFKIFIFYNINNITSIMQCKYFTKYFVQK
nr:MAG TPA: hypothetical protein [Caudoviricetes sp.]